MPELRVDEDAAPGLRELRILRRAHRDLERDVGRFSGYHFMYFICRRVSSENSPRGSEFIHHVTNKFRAAQRFHCFSASLSAT